MNFGACVPRHHNSSLLNNVVVGRQGRTIRCSRGVYLFTGGLFSVYLKMQTVAEFLHAAESEDETQAGKKRRWRMNREEREQEALRKLRSIVTPMKVGHNKRLAEIKALEFLNSEVEYLQHYPSNARGETVVTDIRRQGIWGPLDSSSSLWPILFFRCFHRPECRIEFDLKTEDLRIIYDCSFPLMLPMTKHVKAREKGGALIFQVDSRESFRGVAGYDDEYDGLSSSSSNDSENHDDFEFKQREASEDEQREASEDAAVANVFNFHTESEAEVHAFIKSFIRVHVMHQPH